MKKIIDKLDVELIKDLDKRGFTQRKIADLHDVSTSTINKVLNPKLAAPIEFLDEPEDHKKLRTFMTKE